MFLFQAAHSRTNDTILLVVWITKKVTNTQNRFYYKYKLVAANINPVYKSIILYM